MWGCTSRATTGFIVLRLARVTHTLRDVLAASLNCRAELLVGGDSVSGWGVTQALAD